jgi:hypothetical protein
LREDLLDGVITALTYRYTNAKQWFNLNSGRTHTHTQKKKPDQNNLGLKW